MLIRYGYTIFIGILLATLLGVGISAFYKGPAPIDYPARLKTAAPSASESAQATQDQEKYDQEIKEFQKKNEDYNKNVSIISLILSILVLTISLLRVKEIKVIADGLLLGGILTLIYSIVRGFSSGDSQFRFIVVAISFIIALYLGYKKFLQEK